MSFLSLKLTQRIRFIRMYLDATQKGLLRPIKPLIKSRYKSENDFQKAFNHALAFHLTGDLDFSEKTINSLYSVVNEYRSAKGISPMLHRLLASLHPYVEEMHQRMELRIELEKMQQAHDPLKLHAQRLQDQLRQLIKENVALITSKEHSKDSARALKELNARLEMKLKTFEQEAKLLRTQNGCMARLHGALKSYLGLTLNTLSPDILEKVRQLYLFKEEPTSFEDLSKLIEKDLKELLFDLDTEAANKPLSVQPEQLSEETLMTNAQQKLLLQLNTLWNDINTEARSEKAFCAIVETIRRMYEPARQGFNFVSLRRLAPTLQHRYSVLKQALHTANSSEQDKPMFSTQDAAEATSSSLLSKIETKSKMIELLDTFFNEIQKLLEQSHTDIEISEFRRSLTLPDASIDAADAA